MRHLQQATINDASLIASFSEKVFNTSFPGLLDMGVSLEILNRYYNEETIKKNILEKEVYLLLLDEDQLVGYVSVEPMNEELWILHKLYVSPLLQNQHIGAYLMDEALKYIINHITKSVNVELNLNRYNTPALKLYKKKGFEVVREENTMLGAYQKTDFVMRKKLLV